MGLLDRFSAFAVARMCGRFERAHRHSVDFSASRFSLLTTDSRVLFVTNRHNVNPTIKQTKRIEGGARTESHRAAVEPEVPSARFASIASIPTTEFWDDSVKTTHVLDEADVHPLSRRDVAALRVHAVAVGPSVTQMSRPCVKDLIGPLLLGYDLRPARKLSVSIHSPCT